MSGSKHMFSSLEVLETETPKNEKLGKIVTRKNKPFFSITLMGFWFWGSFGQL